MARLALGAMRQKSEAALGGGVEMPNARGPSKDESAATPRHVALLRKNWRRVRAALRSEMELAVSIGSFISPHFVKLSSRFMTWLATRVHAARSGAGNLSSSGLSPTVSRLFAAAGSLAYSFCA